MDLGLTKPQGIAQKASARDPSMAFVGKSLVYSVY